MSVGGNPSYVTIGATTTTALKENPYRRRVTFCNTSTNIIYLSHAAQLVAGSGIPLMASGGNLVDELNLADQLYRGTWYAIASGAGSNLSIEEET